MITAHGAPAQSREAADASDWPKWNPSGITVIVLIACIIYHVPIVSYCSLKTIPILYAIIRLLAKNDLNETIKKNICFFFITDLVETST